jgi:hypothetical protein
VPPLQCSTHPTNIFSLSMGSLSSQMLLPINKLNNCTLNKNTCKWFAMCLDVPERYTVPWVTDGYIFKQDTAPPYFWRPVINPSMRNLQEYASAEVATFCGPLNSLNWPHWLSSTCICQRQYVSDQIQWWSSWYSPQDCPCSSIC